MPVMSPLRHLPRALSLLLIICLLGTSSAEAQDKLPTSRPTSRPAAKAKPKSKLPPLGAPAGVFGEGVKLQKALRLRDVAKNVDAVKGKTIRIDGLLRDVCRKKGCWVVLKDGKHEVRVKFKDYAFFVPRDATGRRAILQGVLSTKTISEAVAKHYAEEGGNPAAAKSIKGPQTVLSFMATGAEVLGKRVLPPTATPTVDAMTKLQVRLGAGTTIAKTKPIKSAVSALWLLRDLPGPRTREFTLHTSFAAKGQTWWVFSAAKAKAFASGIAVRSDGQVVRF